VVPIYDANKARRRGAIAECRIGEEEILTIEISMLESERWTKI
jgi:hypothetical protein